MGNKRIENSAKMIALRLLRRGRDSRREIANICGFSTRTLRRTVVRHQTTGSVAKAAAIGRGGPRLLHTNDSNYLLKLARHDPCKFLDEYQHFLERYRHIPVHICTLHRTFERAGLRVARVQKMASERDPILEGNFITRISQYPAHYLVALDKTSKDDRTYARLHGAVGAFSAAPVIEGSSDQETFIDYLRNDLVSGSQHIIRVLNISSSRS
ncbi:hypothetical protein GGX14DRAFT_372508 [Mycena pura]|uniref:Uncharacterized protein n=1 Tax=Mycena pura TaxID=153505 RepID=A0AAD6V5J6_9AGAR|nr:hypothetical protein GGX14DRAFT_372508 [Mycena pura]